MKSNLFKKLAICLNIAIVVVSTVTFACFVLSNRLTSEQAKRALKENAASLCFAALPLPALLRLLGANRHFARFSRNFSPS